MGSTKGKARKVWPFLRWIRQQRFERFTQIINSAIDWLDLNSPPAKPAAQSNGLTRHIALLGFCFGGWIALRIAGGRDALANRIHVIAVCHPAPGLERMIHLRSP